MTFEKRRRRRTRKPEGQPRTEPRSSAGDALPREPRTFLMPLKGLSPRPTRPVRTVEVSAVFL